MTTRLLTKEQIVDKFRELQGQGWVRNSRPQNDGGIGNTIDDLLGFPENNLPISDTAQWELKSHRLGSSSLVTLFHMEPEPRSERIVPKLLLPSYGWPDQNRPDELSFRQTLNAAQLTDRGFTISLDRSANRLEVVFDSTQVDDRHHEWLLSIVQRIGLGRLNPQPYWNVQQLALKVSTKMLNSFFVEAETTRTSGQAYFRIHSVLTLQGFSTDRFMNALEGGAVYVDFDARTHHNHGTKFRLRSNVLPTFYQYVEQVV